MTRSPQAQEFHTELLHYINGGQSNLSRLVEKLSSPVNRSFILETSVHGYSHLMDILHLSYQQDMNLGRDGSEIAHTLFDLFKTYTTPKEWRFLLFNRSDRLFFPLQQALMTKDFSIYKKCEQAYVDVLKKLGPSKEYSSLLMNLMDMIHQPNAEGFNCLHTAIFSGSPEMLEAFINFFYAIYENVVNLKTKPQPSFLTYLLTTDFSQNNPIHLAIFHHNPNLLKLLLTRLFGACKSEEKHLIHHALSDTNLSNLNTLMQAVKRDDIECLKFIFKLLNADVFPRSLYKQVLMSQHQSTYSPLHLVLQSSKTDVYTLFSNYLFEAFETKLISRQELAAIFLYNGELSYPLLYNALFATPDIFQLYQKDIQKLIQEKIIGKNEWQKILTFRDNQATSLWIISLKEKAKPENLLDYLRTLIPLLTTQAEVASLAELGNLGFNALDLVLESQNAELFSLYFSYLVDAQKSFNLSYLHHELFYNKQSPALLNHLVTLDSAELLSFFFSKLDDKNKHMLPLITASLQKNSSFYQVLSKNESIFKTLMQEIKPYLSTKEFKKLLTHKPIDQSEEPIFWALRNQHPMTFCLYLMELEELQKQGYLSNQEFYNLFFNDAVGAPSLLSFAIKHANPDSIDYLLKTISKLSQENQCNIYQQVNACIIFYSQMDQNEYAMENYLRFLEHVLIQRLLPDNELKKRLVPQDAEFRSLLNRVIEEKSYPLAQLYFSLLSKGIEFGIISKSEYKSYIMTKSYYSVSPLSACIASKNTDLLSYYWRRLQGILKNTDDFSQYILENNPIHRVCYTACPEILKVIMENLTQLFKDKPGKLLRLLEDSNYRMVLNNCGHPKADAPQCMTYLQDWKHKLEQAIYPKRSYVFFTQDDNIVDDESPRFSI